MTQDQLEVFAELEDEINFAEDPEKREELERTLTVCKEIAYAIAEGMIEVEECPDGELRYYPVA